MANGFAAARVAGGVALSPAMLSAIRTGLWMGRFLPYAGSALLAAAVLNEIRERYWAKPLIRTAPGATTSGDWTQCATPAGGGCCSLFGSPATIEWYGSPGIGGCITVGCCPGLPGGGNTPPLATDTRLFQVWRGGSVPAGQQWAIAQYNRSSGSAYPLPNTQLPPLFAPMPFPFAVPLAEREYDPLVRTLPAVLYPTLPRRAATRRIPFPVFQIARVPAWARPGVWEFMRDMPVNMAAYAAPGARGEDRRAGAAGIGAVAGAGVIPGVGVVPEAISEPVPVPLAPGLPGVRAPVIPTTGIGVVVVPGVKPRVIPIARPVARTVPMRPITELKGRVFAQLQGLRMGMSAATEPVDALKAIHDALPKCAQTRTAKMARQGKAARANGWNKKYRAAGPSINQMLSDISNYARRLARDPRATENSICGSGVINPTPGVHRPDKSGSAMNNFVGRVARNLMAEEISDHLRGRSGQELGKISRGLGLPAGLETIGRITGVKPQ